jgi:soluble lytic murein transglycosylase-like protein
MDHPIISISFAVKSVVCAAVLLWVLPVVAQPLSSGTGFVIGLGGAAITNAHVVDGCWRLQAHTAAGASEVAVIARDNAKDLALLRIATASGITPLSIAVTPVELGASVTVLGYPLTDVLGANLRVTAGLVSSLSGVRGDTKTMQISAAVQPGNSGGPVIDEYGSVVGIVVAKLASRFNAENVNFAITAPVLTSFLQTNRVQITLAARGRVLPVAEIVKKSATGTVLLVCYPAVPPSNDERDAVLSQSLVTALGATAPPIPQFRDIEARLAYLRWLGAMSSRIRAQHPEWLERKEFLQTVWYEARRAGIDPGLLLAMISTMSNFRKFYVSDSGARGYMAIAPYWTRKIGDGQPQKLFVAQVNLRYGCVLLRHYIDVRQGNLIEGLTDYVANNLTIARTDPRTRKMVNRIMRATNNFEFHDL